MKYIIECAGCGTENTRYHLPEKMLCSECDEAYYIHTWREVETRKYRRSDCNGEYELENAKVSDDSPPHNSGGNEA